MAPRRVLLIDDEDDIREIAQLSLEMVAHWDVTTARSGREGLARAVEDQPDAILLDVMMPDLDGPATLSQLRANPLTREIPVVFVTAKTQSELAELVFVTAKTQSELAELPVHGVIHKPFDPLDLSRQVSDTLGWAA